MAASILALSLLGTTTTVVGRTSLLPHDRTVAEAGDTGRSHRHLMGPLRSDDRGATQADHTPASVTGFYRQHTARYWAARFRQRTRQLQNARAHIHATWHPTVMYALRLASAVFGVPYSELATVSHCESTWNPFARNGRQLGLFQLGWAPFGLSPFDPVANALSAAQTVQHDGGWGQWTCKP